MGRSKRVSMSELRIIYEKLGFHSVTTYIQSGNILFKSNDIDTSLWENKIAQSIGKTFGFDVVVAILELEGFKQIVDENPFLKKAGKNTGFLHITFLCSPPQEYDKKIIENRKREGEEILISNNAVYLYCPHGYAKTKLTNNFFEELLKVKATTRNWNTVCRLLEKAV